MKIIHKMFIAPTMAMIFLALLGVLSLAAMGQQDQRMFSLTDVTFAPRWVASSGQKMNCWRSATPISPAVGRS